MTLYYKVLYYSGIILCCTVLHCLGLVVRGEKMSSSSSPSSPSTLVETLGEISQKAGGQIVLYLFLGTWPSPSSFLASTTSFFFIGVSKSCSLALAYCLEMSTLRKEM